MRTMDLRLWILASYLTAAGIGSGPSQYQWMVSSVTNFAQVLSSGGLVKNSLKKVELLKINLWTRLTAKEEDG